MEFKLMTRCDDGFSIIELLFSIMLVTMLLFGSIKMILHWRKVTDSITQQQMVSHGLQFAIQQAWLRHQVIAWCPSQDNQKCALSGQANGQLVWFESQQSRKLLYVNQHNIQKGLLYFRSFPKYRSFITIKTHPYLQSDNATIWYCLKNSKFPVFAIFLNNRAHMRVVKPNKQGIILDAYGNSLMC